MIIFPPIVAREVKLNIKIPLSSPDITNKESRAVLKTLKNQRLSLGPKAEEFEHKFAKYIGAKYAICVNSGTSGLHLCIRALGIKDGDEVITSSFSFIASANCILFERANPVFVDIDPETLNIDVKKIEERITRKTKAILAVHVFGYPCSMAEILKLSRKYNLAVIEDTCEAIGAEFYGRKAGTFGKCGIFGFYPNKQITTGEGGMIVTNDAKIAKLCRSMRNQGRKQDSRWLEHERLGYNYRLSDINCALGVAQLGRIKEILKKRERVASIYNEKLSRITGIKLPFSNSKYIQRSWFVYVVRLNDNFSRFKRDKIIEKLRQERIECGSYFPCIHLQPFYRKEFGYKKTGLPITESISDRTIALPFYNNLKEKQIDYISKKLKKLLL